MRRVLEINGHPGLKGVEIPGGLWVSENSTSIMVHDIDNHIIYQERKTTGDPERWSIDRIPAAVETMRKHLVLDLLSDV